MAEDHFVFEILIHVMELSVVAGIGITVWITRRLSLERNHERHNRAAKNPNSDAHSR